MIRFKDTVKCPHVVFIVAAAANARPKTFPGECYVTSLNDSVHMAGSKHYTDEAADFRTHDLTPAQIASWADLCRVHLGAAYQVIVEADHLHIEWDPKP